MGGLHEQVGPFTIETRGPSFIVHASYGYRPRLVEVGSLALADEFLYEGENYMITVLDAEQDKIAAHCKAGRIELPFTTQVERPGYKEPVDSDFAHYWRDHHPEFLLADLNDLIVALKAISKSSTDTVTVDYERVVGALRRALEELTEDLGDLVGAATYNCIYVELDKALPERDWGLALSNAWPPESDQEQS